MQISSRFTMAIHMFACIDVFKDMKMTSDFMAASIGTNPVIIRKLLQQLKAADLVEVLRGTGGVKVKRSFHEKPNQKCPVGRNIHHVLDSKLDKVQRAMEQELAKITLEDVKEEMEEWIRKENE